MAPTPEFRPLRVLVAEDNPINQRLVRVVLQQRGHIPVLVSNGREALAALEGEAFDVVLMDVHMPEMGGIEAAAAIRAREASTGAHLPIFALTASAGAGDEKRCLATGMDGFLSKPIRAEELIERLESAVAPRDAAGPQPFGKWKAAGGDAARRLTRLFVTDAARLGEEIRDAVARRDGGALQAAAHRLRGSAGYFAAHRAFELAARLEHLGKAGDFTADTETACQELTEELARLDGELGAEQR